MRIGELIAVNGLSYIPFVIFLVQGNYMPLILN